MRRTSQLRIYCISNTNLLLYSTLPPTTFTYSSPYHLLHHRFRKKFLLYSLLNKFTNTKKLKTIKTDNKEMIQETTLSTSSNLDDSSTETGNQTNLSQTQPSRQPRKRQLRSSKKCLRLHPIRKID